MARLDRFSAFSEALRRLFPDTAKCRARRELGRKVFSTRSADASRRRVRPCLEVLEDRITPSTTFAPTTNADGVTGTTQVNTLRDAILAANRDTGTGTDTIQLQGNTTYTLSIANSNGHELVGTEGDLNIKNTSHALVIQGSTDDAGNPTTTIDQTAIDRVFEINTPGITVTFKNLIIEGGQAQDNGAAGTKPGIVEADGGGILDNGSDVTLSNVILVNNSADAGPGLNANGGGIYLADTGGSLTIEDSIIQKNAALSAPITDASNHHNGGFASGGGIFALGQTSIDNSTLSGNVVTGGNCTSGDAGNAEGGGVFAVGPTTITASTLSGNTLSAGSSNDFGFGGNAEGGGVLLGAGQSSALTITGSNLSGNTLTGGNGGGAGNADGGSVFVKSSTTITDCTLSNNTLNGGVGNSHANLPGNTDIGGEALGGGIFSLVGTLTISASTLSGNTLNGGQGTLNDSNGGPADDVGGEVFGGGVFANGSTTISNSVLSGNTLTGGDGHYVSGTVGGNVGGNAEGGGVYFNPAGTIATLAITASTLSGNTVTGGAGSVLGAAATPGLAMGGGTYLAGPGAHLAGGINTLVNSTIANNQAIGGQGIASNPDASGGGLFFDSTVAATLTNDTVVENNASLSPSGEGASYGGGINNAGGHVTLVNTLMAFNFATNGPDYFGPVVNSDRNLIRTSDGSSGFSAAHGDKLGTLANPLNPQLVSLGNNGGPTQTIALLPGSPAINAGDNNAESVTGQFDQRGPGFARVVGGIIDIGAFEFQPPPNSPPPGSPPTSPPSPPAPSLLSAILGLFIAEVEKDIGFGNPTALQQTIDFDSRFTVLFGINIASLIESIADNDVAQARGG